MKVYNNQVFGAIIRLAHKLQNLSVKALFSQYLSAFPLVKTTLGKGSPLGDGSVLQTPPSNVYIQPSHAVHPLPKAMAILLLLITVGVGNVWGETITETLTSSEINAKETEQLKYGTPVTWTDTTITYIISANSDAKQRNWFQLKANDKSTYVYVKITTPEGSNISKVKLQLTGAANARNGANEISKNYKLGTTNGSTTYKHIDVCLMKDTTSALTAEVNNATNANYIIGKNTNGNLVDSTWLTISDIPASGNIMYLRVSRACRIWNLQVTYETTPACQTLGQINGPLNLTQSTTSSSVEVSVKTSGDGAYSDAAKVSGYEFKLYTAASGGTATQSGSTDSKDVTSYTFDDLDASTDYWVTVRPIGDGSTYCNTTAESDRVQVQTSAAASYCISVFNSSSNTSSPYPTFTSIGSNEFTLLYTIPDKSGSNWPQYWVGENNANSNTFSKNANFADMPLLKATSSTLGLAAGATGTLHIWDDNKQSESNLWIKFDPDGYGMSWGKEGSSWTFLPFSVVSGSTTVYETEMQTLTSDQITNYKYWVGLKTASSYVYSGVDNETDDSRGVSRKRDIKDMKVRSTNNAFKETSLNSESANIRGKFRIWVDNSDDYNFYCHFVPYHRVVFKANYPSGSSPADTYSSEEVSVEESQSNIALAAAPTAPEGYKFAGWYTVATGGTKVTEAQTIVVGATADIVLYAHWTERAKYTMTYSVPSCASVTPTAAQTTVTEGNTIGTLPTPSAITGYTFYGWSQTEQTRETDVAPAIISESFVPTGNQTLYAVYKRTAEAARYTKVTTISDGVYLMATTQADNFVSKTTLAYAGKDADSNVRGAVVAVTISDGVISTKPESAVELTIHKGDNGKFSIKMGEEWITKASNDGKFAYSNTEVFTWQLTGDAGYILSTIDSSDEYNIILNNGNSGLTSEYFVPMKDKNEGANNGSYYYHAVLYKKSGGTFYTTAACKVLTPVISPADGTMLTAGSNTVTITCATPDATIYYTTDGSEPSSSNGTEYSASFTLNSAATVKAIAVKSGLDNSAVAETEYDWGKEFVLATSSTTFEDGDEIIITNSGSNQALSTTQNDNNRGQTSVTASSSKILVAGGGAVQIITLEEKEGNKWLFKVREDAYLYAASNKSNHLKTNTKTIAGANGEWTISIGTINSESNVATVKAEGENKNNQLQYNSSSSIFSCYSNSQGSIRIYYYHRSDPYITLAPSALEPFTYAVSYGPSLAQAITVKGYNLTGDLTVACPSGYELSATSPISGFAADNLTLRKDANNKVNKIIYVRLAAGKSAGTYNQTLTISGGGITAENISLAGSVEAVPSGTRYQLLTDAVDLFPDDEVVILNASGDYALGTTPTDKAYREAQSSGFSLVGRSVFVSAATIQNIKLEGADDEWRFKVDDENNKYLYSGTSSNDLKTNTWTYAETNGKWNISVNDYTGVATVKSNLNTTENSNRNLLSYNYSSGNTPQARFSCYASVQQDDIKLYVKPSSTANVCGSPTSLTGFSTTYGAGASAAQSFSVKARNISSGNVSVTAPTGYEVSTAERGTYAGSVTLVPTDGKVAPTTVWVRLKADNNAGTYNGNITISATGATSRTIALTGEVAKADPGLAFTAEDFGDAVLSGSSVEILDVFTSRSDGAYTVTIEADAESSCTNEGLRLDTENKKFIATEQGYWTVSLSQAASTNYLAGAEVSVEVLVACGTPAAPTNLTVDAITSQGATLHWDAVDGAVRYMLSVGDADDYVFEKYDIDAGTTSYELDDLSPNTEYFWTLNVKNICGDTLATANVANGDDFTTLPIVTYHDADDEHSVDVVEGSVPAYTAAECASGKVFVGWSASEITSLQQTEPTIATRAGALSGVTTNTDLYAVYASRNGGKSTGSTSVVLNEDWSGSPITFEAGASVHTLTTPRATWLTNVRILSGEEYTNPVTAFTLEGTTYTCPRCTVNNVDQYMQSKQRFYDLKDVNVSLVSDGHSGTCKVLLSADGGTWTEIGSQSYGSGKSVQTLSFAVPKEMLGAFFVKVQIDQKSSLSSAHWVGLTRVEVIEEARTYWYSDYSTTCDMATSATLTMSDGGSITSVGPQNVLPYIYTIDSVDGGTNTVPTKSGYLFDYYEIQSIQYSRGDVYMLSHDVDATAHWIAMPAELSATDMYVTSGNGFAVQASMQIAATSSFHTSGTLTIANATGDKGGTFTAQISDATATASGLDAGIRVSYQPTQAGVSETATMTAVINGIESTFTVHGRSLPESFVVVANPGAAWVALPADMGEAGTYKGYSVVVDDASAPTVATMAPANALYKAYGKNGVDAADFIRLAAADGGATLWSSQSNTIRNYAAINGGSATGAQYNWQLATADNETYTLYNTAANSGAGRTLNIKEQKWGVNGATIQTETIRFLPVSAQVTQIPMEATDWESDAFTFTTNAAIPSYNSITLTYNGSEYAGEMTGSRVYTMRGTGVDLAAAPGTVLMVQWKDADAQVVAYGSVITPIIISDTESDTYLDPYDAEALKQMDVHVSGTLNVNADRQVHNVTVASGGSLNILGSATLRAQSLSLKGGWNSTHTAYDMPRIYIASGATLYKTETTVNMDVSVDKETYYPLAVPFAVKVSNIDYADASLARFSTYGTHYVIRQYNGATRAERGTVDDCWETVGSDATLEPGRGYILTAVPVGGSAVIRIPLTFANEWTSEGEKAIVGETTKNMVSVTAHEGAATAGSGVNATRHKGWNMVGVPYMSCYTSGAGMYTGEGAAALINGKVVVVGGADIYAYEGTDVPYVSVPSHDFAEYIQTDITQAHLLPGWSFFVQVGETGNLTFLSAQQAQDMGAQGYYAPRRDERATQPVRRLTLTLTDGDASDRTTLLVSDKYSNAYEIGADLEKLFGKAFKLSTYTLSNGMPLAYNALSTSDASALIPLGVRIAEQGTYTFAMLPSEDNASFERVDLIDYETGELTDLLHTSYTFTSIRGEHNGRFAINAVRRSELPTSTDAPIDSGGVGAEKRLVNGELYIYTREAVYDANGKRVFIINQ